MSKHYKAPLWRRPMVFVSAFLILLFSYAETFAQRTDSFENGKLRIKVSEQLAQQLERATLKSNANKIVLTGIQSIDNVSQQYKVSAITRVFRPAGKFEARHRRYGLHLWYEIQIDKSASVLDALGAFKQISLVEKTEPVFKKAIIGSENKDYGPRVVPTPLKPVTLPGASNDQFLASQWHYNNTGQTGGTPGADIKLFQAWGIETGKPQVIVAVTDGGIQVNHPDIVSNIWINTDEIPGNNIDDDNNGYVDDINGYGFGDNTGTIAPDPHGTHTSGTIGATTNNSIGVAGIAGGSGTGDGVRLMSCAAFGANDSGGFAETYVYGADNGAVISQNSWGYTSADMFEQAVLDGIDYFIAEAGKDENGNQIGPMKGGIVIFAAGNDDTNAHHYPGFYAPTVAVSGVNHMDKKAWYSNYGDWVDIAAPGGETNTVSQQGVLSTLSNSQYGFFQGTSMATPHVSGVAALIVSSFGGPGLTPDMVRGRLIQTTNNIDGVNPNFVGLLGSGRLNAFAALQQNDHIAPDSITNLTATGADITSVSLQWTSPSDQGNGSASTYDIRYATFPINEWNFDSASVAPNPPIPSIAGAIDSYVVAGLAPGTVYYFAIKSIDFFGNVSTISNVVQRSTEFPPVISVTPTWIADSLVTAQLSIHNVTVSNTGNGPLIYQASSSDNFIRVLYAGDTVSQGTSKAFSVMLDANNLLAGDYTGKVYVTSNDPLHDSTTVNILLHVTNNGVPIATVSPDSTLYFGGVYVGGTINRTIDVHNSGSETLRIWETSLTGSDFSIAGLDTLYVAAFRDTTINVQFHASAIGVATGTLGLSTNDPIHPSYSITLHAEGLEAPGIEVSLDSLTASLHTGRTSTQQLTIQNTGGSDLTYSIKVKANTSNPTTTQLALKPTIQSKSSSGAKLNRSNIVSTVLQIKSVGQYSTSTKVLIVTPDANTDDLAQVLNSFGDVQAKKFPVDSLPLISLSNLVAYDVVMTTNNGQWQATGNVAPEVIGNLLADYVDQGGKVIVNQFAYSYDAWKMTGRFIEQHYGPFISATTDENVLVSLDSINTSHPIMQGVSSIDYDGFVQNVILKAGSTTLGKWSNGELFAAANDNVVALNILPSIGDGSGLPWVGDLPTFYHNSIHWLAGPSFVKVSPSKGAISAGGSSSLDVTFDAGSLQNGTYSATIQIASNVPGKEITSIPAILNVLGPQFTISPDSIALVLEKEATESRTIILTNNGSDNQPFTVHVRRTDGAAADATIKIAPVQHNATARVSTPSVNRRVKTYDGPLLNDGTQVLSVTSNSRSKARKAQNSTITYSTDFESFGLGDIDGQQNWEGQYGNWTVETGDAVSGTQNLHSVADGLGQTLCFSPTVSIGTEAISTATMKVNVEGSGVTWQVIPQSPSAGFINTRVEFSADGTSRVLIRNSSGSGTYLPINAPVPNGYFDLTIAVNRDSATFSVSYNDDVVFQGQGFAGDIEQVVFLSLMETAGPILDVDDFQIIDGVFEAKSGYLTVTPVTGVIEAGESVALTATFNTSGLDFGYYHSDVVVGVADLASLSVPTTLRVVGDPTISVDPTVLQAIVGYGEDTVKNFSLKNTGGNDINYSLSIIGAGTDMAKLPANPINKFKASQSSTKVQQKIANDKAKSKSTAFKQEPIKLLAGASLLQEGFDSLAFPPTGWTAIDNAGSGVVWNLASEWGEGNYSGVGDAATVSSDAFGEGEFDTELRTPSIATSGYKDITVQYSVNYQNYAKLDFLDLDIKVDGGAWTTVLSWNEDHGSFRGTPGELVSINLDSYLVGSNSFQLRWHYYDPNTGDFDWYAQIDNVVVLGDPRTWLTVNPAAGIIPVGSTANIDARYYSQGLEPGLYVAGILVNSNAVNTPLVGVVASLTVQNPAVIEVTPTSVTQTLVKGQTASQVVTVSNHGESDLKFTVDGITIAGSPDAILQRKVSTEKRSVPSVQKISMTDALSITRIAQTSSSDLYATGFEEFATGDISGQGDWSAQFGNWTVENSNPYSGTQHFRGLADGLGQSVAFSPEVAIGTESISSATMRINLSNAATTTWQVIPQSTTAHFVNTRIQVSPDGSVQALVADSLGGAGFANIATPAPTGYFELKIEVERATAIFSVFYNNVKVFEGQGFAGDIEEIVILSAMETDGPVLDIDNLAILDGRPQAPWLVVSPTSGIVHANSSAQVTLAFDARELSGGSYFDTLRIHSNDPVTPSVAVSVELNVIENHPPQITFVGDTTVIEGQTLNLTFNATDSDDSLVNVWLADWLPFVTFQSKGATSATYSFKPVLGNAGFYPLTVIANDGRGGFDSLFFGLTVIPYGIKNFSLYNTKTKAVVQNFNDSVSVNLARPDFEYLIIRANTNPDKIGSVVFKMDGVKTNSESIAPYDLKKSALQNLTPGAHWLSADAYTKANGKGVAGKGLVAKINVISESIITYFDIVNASGTVLKQLHNNDVINIGNDAYKKITIVAHVNESKVGSVVFKLNDITKTENQTPYALNGDSHGYYKPWPFVTGQYWLEGTPYSKAGGHGTVGMTNSLTFWVVNTDTLAGNASTRFAGNEFGTDESNDLGIYPVPTKDEIQLTLPERITELRIVGTTGEVLHHARNLDGVRQYSVSTNKLGIVSGVYFVQAINDKGQRHVKKFIKE